MPEDAEGAFAGVVEFEFGSDGAGDGVAGFADVVVGEDAAEEEEIFEAFDAVLFELGDELARCDPAQIAAVVLDVETGEQRVLSRSIYAVDAQGRYAMSLNFARLDRTRPGYGYKGVVDPSLGKNAPDDDGIYAIDLTSGESQLVISLAQLAALRPHDSMRDAEHWVNHLQCSRSGHRFAFLHRWRQQGHQGWFTRLLTAAPDGHDIAILADEGYVSHYDWRGEDAVLAWARHNDERHYHHR